MRKTLGLAAALGMCLAATGASGDVLDANPTANNGGSSGWGLYFDLTSNGPGLAVTHMTTANNGTAFSSFSVEIFVRSGSGLGNPGPGQSMDGWTSLGTAPATQGPENSGISDLIDIPDIAVGPGETVGVAVLFSTNGPRYFGTGSPPLQVFEDANLKLTTGDSRSAPFTNGGSFFSSRGLVGSLTYEAGGYRCSVTGECPGTLNVAWAGAQPNRQQAIVFAASRGSLVVPSGPCQGTQLGLSAQGIRIINTIGTGGNGTGNVNGRAGTGACGGFIQLVTISNPCEASNVGQIP